MSARLTTLRSELKDLVVKRQALEDVYYALATEEFGLTKEATQKKIATARSQPQKSKRLQSIHEAHRSVLSKTGEITKAEGALATIKAFASHDVTPHTKGQQENEVIGPKSFVLFIYICLTVRGLSVNLFLNFIAHTNLVCNYYSNFTWTISCVHSDIWAEDFLRLHLTEHMCLLT